MSLLTYNEEVFSDRFINETSEIVKDTLLGIINSYSNLGLLNYGNVIVRRDYAERDVVKIVSGGPSGHEPFQSGFVGKGMLTAAIQGDVLCSPCISVILNTIKEVSYKLTAGVLVIVQNNKSDCLNFAVAVERAHNQDICIKMVVVNDEYCEINENQGKRGLSGIILVNKIAGAMAEMSMNLEVIYNYCLKVIKHMSSILFSLKSNNIDEIEIGSGLHGERGLLIINKTSVKETCRVIINHLKEYFSLDSGISVVILINNLGKSLLIEELTFTKEIVNCLQGNQICIARIYHGKFLTSLDINGFSLTVLKIFDDKILHYLDYYCEAPDWGFKNVSPIIGQLQDYIVCRVSKRRRPTKLGPFLTSEQTNAVYFVLQSVCDALISCEKHINFVDSDNGNGNLGTKIKYGAQAVLELIQNNSIDFCHPKKLFQTLSEVSEKKINSAIGSFYCIIFESAANYFRGLSERLYVDCYVWLNCLKEVNFVIKTYGTTEFGSGTMYDPLFACSESLSKFLQDNQPMEALRLTLDDVVIAVSKTKQGSRKYVDPGAEAVKIWMKAIYEGLLLRYD